MVLRSWPRHPGTNGANQDYKSMQFLYLSKQLHSARISGLLFADEFGRYKLDSVRNIAGEDTGYIYGWHFNQPGVNARLTGGLLLKTPLDRRKSWNLQAGAYYQAGKDRRWVQTLAAYTSTLSLTYNRQRFSWTIGWDYLSGNNSFSTSATDHRFDPLYGTPHKFWGYMDYFYAGSGSATGGLNNPFAKAKYTSRNSRLSLELDYHYFGLAAEQKKGCPKGGPVSKYLGSEADLITDYNLNKITTLELGLCGLSASHSMEYAKGITPGTARLTPVWAYLQFNIQPDFLTK